MPSESARMNSAAEARFRIQEATLAPRAVAVIALDAASEPVVARLAQSSWHEARFLTASAGHLLDDIETADLVVMVATPGAELPAVPAIGAACSARRVMTTALVTGAESASEEALVENARAASPLVADGRRRQRRGVHRGRADGASGVTHPSVSRHTEALSANRRSAAAEPPSRKSDFGLEL